MTTAIQRNNEYAQELAANVGRDWSDMSEYEREMYRDEARHRHGTLTTALNKIDDFLADDEEEYLVKDRSPLD